MVKSLPALTLWLNKEVKRRGWTLMKFAAQAGTKPGTLSPILAGAQRPDLKMCRAIAKALNVPDETVLALAGHVTPVPDLQPDELALVHRFRQLPPDDQQEFVSMLDLRLARLKSASFPAKKKHAA
jgi:transcriptional regulator with XRE-family HTH domain